MLIIIIIIIIISRRYGLRFFENHNATNFSIHIVPAKQKVFYLVFSSTADLEVLATA